MSRTYNEQEEYYCERIRSILALNPRASLKKIGEALAQDNIKLGDKMVSRLRLKVVRERVFRYDVARVENRIAQMEDHYNELMKQAWRIVIGARSEATKIYAIATIAKMEKQLLEAQMDAGIYERRIGTLDVNKRVRALAPELRASIVNALQKAGVVVNEKYAFPGKTQQPETQPEVVVLPAGGQPELAELDQDPFERSDSEEGGG